MRAKQLGSLLRFQYGSIRGWVEFYSQVNREKAKFVIKLCCSGLTESRWADEIRRTVGSLFNIWLPAATASTTKQQQQHQEMNSLANCFITSGHWLSLPTECQVINITLQYLLHKFYRLFASLMVFVFCFNALTLWLFVYY